MNNKNNGGGLGPLSVLQTIFIVLKLLNLISWSWWAVFIPTFINMGILVLIFVVLMIDRLRY